MNKTFNNKAWWMVLPVFLVVAFNALMPLMTVVNYSVQETFGNNEFFWSGTIWFEQLLDERPDPGIRSGARSSSPRWHCSFRSRWALQSRSACRARAPGCPYASC